MYRDSSNQSEFLDFYLPFGGRLRAENRWARLSELIPWDKFETLYQKRLAPGNLGSPALSLRIALGSLIIKECLGTSDEETAEQIRENPYLQYFLGYREYLQDAPFDPSMFVHFRKRLEAEVICEINEEIVKAGLEMKRLQVKARRKGKKRALVSPDSGNISGSGPSGQQESEQKSNRGKLMLDATCAPADISYPTDLNLLNEAREKAEKIIDTFHKPDTGQRKKPRTYRLLARTAYLAAAKQRRPGGRKLRKAIGQQLGYVKRDLGHIDFYLSEDTKRLSLLSKKSYKDLLVIRQLYVQQHQMHSRGEHRVSDRIVSISQPHVRPIVRGKAGKPTEFGAKLSISVVNGFTYLDKISWDAYNEGIDLKEHVERYRSRFGCYPESLHVDKIYRTRQNLRYCKEHHIRINGPALGRPRTETAANSEELKTARKQARRDELIRNAVESAFGRGKRRYGLGRIMGKLSATSKSMIAICFLTMNLVALSKVAAILYDILCALSDYRDKAVALIKFLVCKIENSYNLTTA